VQKKSPVLAAVLSFVLGPLGYLYIGWRYAVMGLVVFAVFQFVLAITDLPFPHWVGYVVVAVYAWKAFTICSVKNHLIETNDKDCILLDTFPAAAMAMSDLLVGVGMFYGGAMGLYVTTRLLLAGNVFHGLSALLLGTPALVWVGSLVFGFVALGIDAVFTGGAENLFRR
jgi:hypothetical protein